jgi:hypothetical protein
MEISESSKDKILDLDKRFEAMDGVLEGVVQGQAELRMIHVKKLMCHSIKKEDIFVGCTKTADDCLLFGDPQCCIHRLNTSTNTNTNTIL